ncbi:putative secreted protein [Streptomyces davaonensis JCM 4913]|uniref:Putative secreted protein n=1 Tax=Streptomyces davaonensis (strain DSM 101723 / JCM 4913 / KCC S-0913 / 768) TaxID=1214101 RepID=K4QUX8_STRDJ|nr:putative secreted protein [Streptomyces davaonensis JCM 4913]
MRKAVVGFFVALAVVLAVAPLANADQTQTVACCGGTTGF